MKPEPLKGKLIEIDAYKDPIDDIRVLTKGSVFDIGDIRSAVEWLKKELEGNFESRSSSFS